MQGTSRSTRAAAGEGTQDSRWSTAVLGGLAAGVTVLGDRDDVGVDQAEAEFGLLQHQVGAAGKAGAIGLALNDMDPAPLTTLR